MSLTVAICTCALLAAAPARRVDRHVLLAVTLMFFAFLYHDERTLNSFEDRVQTAVAAVPAGSRLVMPVADTGIRANPWWHVLDRACLGRCYSYGNYEPSTLQFRVRARERNAIVAAAVSDAELLRQGGYVVRASDLPIYQIQVDRSGAVFAVRLQAGALCRSVKLTL